MLQSEEHGDTELKRSLWIKWWLMMLLREAFIYQNGIFSVPRCWHNLFPLTTFTFQFLQWPYILKLVDFASARGEGGSKCKTTSVMVDECFPKEQQCIITSIQNIHETKYDKVACPQNKWCNFLRESTKWVMMTWELKEKKQYYYFPNVNHFVESLESFINCIK